MEIPDFSNCDLFYHLDSKYLQTLGGGRNNQVQLYSSEEKKFVVKSFSNDQNENHKYRREVSFLEYCAELTTPRVPRLLGKCDEHRVLLISFEAGNRSPVIDEARAIQILDFLQQLNSGMPRLEKTPTLFAIENVDSLGAFEKTISLRREKIAGLGVDSFKPEAETSKYLRLLNSYSVSALYSDDRRALGPLIERTLRTVRGSMFLSPSDLGAHNMLDQKGEIVFIDFEYSGIDSGINLLGDLITQPDTEWGPGVKRWFASEYLAQFFGLDLVNFESLERIFAFRWLWLILARSSAKRPQATGGVGLSSLVDYYQSGGLSSYREETGAW